MSISLKKPGGTAIPIHVVDRACLAAKLAAAPAATRQWLATVGFKAAADKSVNLAALEILDNFGQLSRLSFSRVELNPALAADTFVFKVPAGADLIRQ